MYTKSLALLAIVAIVPFVTANCNIDSAGLKTYSTSDGLAISKVGVVATFRLGCKQGTPEPVLHAETDNGQYLAVSASNQNKDFKEVSFIEETGKSKSRWIEIRVFDDETYQKLLQARASGSSESYYKPMKTISVSHYGVTGGPMLKMETVAAVALVLAFLYAQTLRSKVVS